MVFDFIREHQLNIMLALSAICAMMAILLLITRFLPWKRKYILILMELIATFLLVFDRAAYIYRGEVSSIAYVMVRLSNFMVFFLTSAIIVGFNLYLADLLKREGEIEKLPKRLLVAQIGATIGMIMAVVSHFTGFYYYFDDQNVYHRGSGFIFAYLIPLIIPILQYTVIRQYKKIFSKLIYISLVLYIFMPILIGIIQIFTYGISIVNMAMVLVSISLYIFAYLDINNEVLRAHKIEVENLEKEGHSIKRLFDQMATAFINAAEKRDKYQIGHSTRVADYAKRIAGKAGKDPVQCDEIYYSALLHNIGIISIPDAILTKNEEFSKEDWDVIKEKPNLSAQILSNISEYPYLEKSALSASERYDGSGYPKGLKKDEIFEYGRIIAVADEYDMMTTRKRSRDALSYSAVREEFIKQSGVQFDPQYAQIMLQLMDEDHKKQEEMGTLQIESELVCADYRDKVSNGVMITDEEINIYFRYEEKKMSEKDFSAPSIIMFDAYDGRCHDDEKTIEAYKYKEYGEAWFDGKYISTNVRNMEVHTSENTSDIQLRENEYSITAKKFKDHVLINMSDHLQTVSVIAALPVDNRDVYIGLTGENCKIKDIRAVKTGNIAQEGQIKEIAGKISYIDRMQADIDNIQIDSERSDATMGIPVNDEVTIEFHSMSLPSASLVWNCPYIVLFNSEDGTADGDNYKEYALIKLNGEYEDGDSCADNEFHMKKTDEFTGWDDWKKINKEGCEYKVSLRKKGNKVILNAQNLGIEINSISNLKKEDKVYAALTGDKVAVTDIRVM